MAAGRNAEAHTPRSVAGQALRPSGGGRLAEDRNDVARQGAGGSVDLSLSTRTVGDRTVVEVGGEIDVYTAPKLREQLVELVNEGNYHLVVDMEGVDFLDSTGLGVLVGGLKRVRAHEGSLRLVCNQERILKIFRITGLTKVFPIHNSVDEAVAATD
jgi:anti-sigma B factor antagonist